MKLNSATILMVCTAALCGTASAQTFPFNSNVDGWSVYSISYVGEPLATPTPLGAPGFDSVNGLGPGSLRVPDAANETWVGATTAVQGDKSAYYGSSVAYDILYRFSDGVVYAAVGIQGGGLTLYQPHDPPALDVWLHWDFPLVAGAWRVGTISGAIATEAELLQVLSDLKGVFIHTEWKTGPDDTNVDNVAIGPCVGGGGPGCCVGDLNGDGAVDGADLGMLLGAWGGTGGDLSGDGTTDGADLGVLLGNWGPCA